MENLKKEEEEEDKMSAEERQAQLLHIKIYNVMIVMYNNVLGNSFKEKWVWPKKELKTGLYKEKHCKFSF